MLRGKGIGRPNHPAPLNDRGRFAHLHGDEHSLKSPECLCLDQDDALKWQGVVASMPKSPLNGAVNFID